MKVTAFIRQKSASKNNVTAQSRIFFRVRDTGGIDLKAASELTINPNHWSQEKQGYKSRVALITADKQNELNRQVQELTAIISEKYQRGVRNEWLQQVIDEYHHPNIYRNGVEGTDTRLISQIELYTKRHDMSQRNIYRLNGIIHKVDRYERYKRDYCQRRAFTLDVGTMTTQDLYDFMEFMRGEYQLVDKCARLYDGLKRNQIPKQELADNGLADIMGYLRTIFKWCEENGVKTNKPFASFEMPKVVYGTPFFLTLEERDAIYNLDLSNEKNQLRYHRDIFMFQCMVGCRQGDIPRMTRDNIIDDAFLEYIPHKTMKTSGRKVRVPLSEKCKAVLERYKDRTGTLLPYYEDWEYNRSIRQLIKMADITRKVSVIDKLTKKEVLKPLTEVASSHMARRTFIGNLYNKVKDPNLIASMSGHCENSKAFTRYRAIDDSMKLELIGMIS